MIANRLPGTATQGRPWGRRVLLAVAAAVAVATVASGVAYAHAGLVDVSPADGSVLAAAPDEVTIRMTEPVTLHADGVVLRNDRGEIIDTPGARVDGAAVHQPLDQLTDGWYVTTWALISQDGHVVRGATSFGVGEADQSARERAAALTTLESPWLTRLSRPAADFTALGALGALIALAITAPAATLRRFTAAFAAAATLSTASWAVTDAAELGGFSDWIGQSHAIGALARTGALLTIAIAAPRLQRLSWKIVAGVAAVVTIASYAAGGHVRSLGAWWLDGTLLAVHIAAGAAWLGATPALWWYITRSNPDDAEAAIRRFSTVATISLPAVIIAGAALGYRAAGGIVIDAYTRVLAVKVVVVAVAGILGYLTRRRLRQGAPSRRQLLGTVGVDSMLLAVAAVASAVLATTTPSAHSFHSGHGTHREQPGMAAECAADINGVTLNVELEPGLPGANTAIITGDLTALTLTLRVTHPALGDTRRELTAARTRGGFWVTDVALPLPGIWDVEIVDTSDRFRPTGGACQIDLGR